MLGMGRPARRRLLGDVPESPDQELVEGGQQVEARGAEPVPHLSPSRLTVHFHELPVLQVAEALGERLGRDATETLHEVGEALGSAGEIAHDEHCPAVPDTLGGPLIYIAAQTWYLRAITGHASGPASSPPQRWLPRAHSPGTYRLWRPWRFHHAIESSRRTSHHRSSPSRVT
jgi:hypothetical protein